MKACRHSGFTLVEIAIVLMIIGLLIGGVLRGQEVMENARVAATIKQLSSVDAAFLTFMNGYRGLPGDLADPSLRLPNCSSSPCNIPGNANNIIGTAFAGAGSFETGSAEHITDFVQLSAVNLLSNVDPNDGWTAANGLAEAKFPEARVGGMLAVAYYNIRPGTGPWVEGATKHWTVLFRRVGTGSTSATSLLPVSLLGKLDRKIDDGRPYSGNAVLNSCAGAVTTYDPNDMTSCTFMVKTSF